MSNIEIISSLFKEAKRIEEDTIYSSKGHFNAESFFIKCNYYLGIPATILAALAGATLIKNYPTCATIFTLLASLLMGLMTFLKLNERAAIHRHAATQFLALRNNTRIFRNVELLDVDQLEKLKNQLKMLSDTRNKLNQESPCIPRWAFITARRGIEEGEARHTVDEEN